jgi:excisionase family DNA binding protein
MTRTDPFSDVIKSACADAIKQVLNITDIPPRRLLTIAQASAYLALSEREIYNMISNGELPAVAHRRRRMLDIRDLEAWIAGHKADPNNA